jgi:tetratricopeptide (TPR) repeat protein
VLEFASAIGLRFRADRLEGVTGQPLHDILDVLAKIERKYYLVKRCQKMIQYAFDHKKTQEVIYNTLGDVAYDIHRQIAAYLENEKEIDPFLVAYHYSKGLDYAKADRYFQLAARKAFESGKFEDAVVFCEETLSIEKNYLKKEPSASLLLLYAESLFLSYNIENALQQLLRLYNYRQEMNILEQARLESLIGKCYYTDGRDELVEKSFPYFKEAIVKYKELNKIENIIECYFDLAASYDHIGAYELAKYSVDDAMKLVATIDDSVLSAIAFRRSCIYYNYQDFPIKLNEAINIFEKNGEKRNLARLLNNLGVEYLEHGKVDKAQEVLAKSLLLFEEVHAFEKDFPTNNLGVVALIKGDYAKAEDLLNISLSHYSEEFNRISTLNNLAYLKAKTGNTNQAKEYAGYITDSLQHFFDLRLKEESLINSGIIYNYLGDHERAFNLLSKTLSIDTTKKKADLLTKIKLQTLIDIYQKMGKSESITEVIEKNKNALAEEMPPLFRLSGYYPCLIAFYY